MSIPRDRFLGVVPVYGSVFSICFAKPHDVVVHTPGAPILWAKPLAGQPASKTFMVKVQTFLNEMQLPGVTMFTNDSIVFYASSSALLLLGEPALAETIARAKQAFVLLGELVELDLRSVCDANEMHFVTTSPEEL
jgi:hypothetical protein